MNLITPNKQPFIQPEIYNKTNYALSFDGVDDYVDIPASADFELNNITIEGKVNLNTYNSRIDILFRVEGQNGWIYELVNYGGGINFFINDGTNSYQCIGSKPALDKTVHWAGTYDGNELKVYLDGNLEATLSYTGGVNISVANVFIAKTANFYTDAIIDEVRVWNTARTQQEIQENMNKELTGSETGLVAYYKINEGSGSTLTDSAGNNDGEIIGATWQEVDY